MILLEEEQARRALEEERMRMEEHARQREQMIGGPPRGVRLFPHVFVCIRVCKRVSHAVKEGVKCASAAKLFAGNQKLEKTCMIHSLVFPFQNNTRKKKCLFRI